MEIKETNVKAAYNAADESGKQMLRNLFPDIDFEKDNRPVTERIKTVEDAINDLGEDHRLVKAYRAIEGMTGLGSDLYSYLKLRIVAAALNEGWEPQFTQDEWRYYAWFYLWTDEELAEKTEEWKRERCLRPTNNYRGEWAGLADAYSHNAPSTSTAYFGSRLCFKSDTLAEYAAKQFIDLWMDFYLIRK